jgi:hypothetical protein
VRYEARRGKLFDDEFKSSMGFTERRFDQIGALATGENES